jgi:hypothetical protein
MIIWKVIDEDIFTIAWQHHCQRPVFLLETFVHHCYACVVVSCKIWPVFQIRLTQVGGYNNILNYKFFLV